MRNRQARGRVGESNSSKARGGEVVHTAAGPSTYAVAALCWIGGGHEG